MNIRGIRNILSGKYLAGSLTLLFFAYPALCADKPKAAPAKPAAAPKAAPAAKPAATGASTSKGSSPTTASHGATTTGSHPTTTTPHAATTTPHSTTSTPHSTTSTPHAPAAGAASHTVAGGKTFGSGGRTATPANHTTVQTRNGSVTKRPDGHVATLHDNKRGMDVHHNLSGNRRVEVERRDHSRVVAERGGRGYVQRPYMYHGHEYARRSYYYNGRYYNHYYGRYYYHGMYVNPYYPSYYYGPAFYGWAYNPWAAPIAYGWGWGGNPWYGYYGAYFTPYPVYATPSLWLTDYIIANSLQAAYQARLNAEAAAMSNPAPLTPETKQLIADEVRAQIALENNESKTAQGAEPDAASSSIQRALTDGKPHVFVAGHDLDVVDAGGTECAISEGDALQLTGQTAPDAQAATLSVLASKGGKECPKGDTVQVSLTDLQDMQNHMRETIDAGMQELQKKQGQGGLPAAPAAARTAPVESAMATAAPPPPPESEVKAEINQQSQEADKAEAEAGGTASGPGPNAAAEPAAAPVNIEIGQTIDQVTGALGSPKNIVNLGAKKIYVYKDMKITFKDGKVADVQ
ncbi:MAG: hypothetical protein ABSG56_27530 [Bryobacteraceae bacterium]|jgi:hypothetical protein